MLTQQEHSMEMQVIKGQSYPWIWVFSTFLRESKGLEAIWKAIKRYRCFTRRVSFILREEVPGIHSGCKLVKLAAKMTNHTLLSFASFKFCARFVEPVISVFERSFASCQLPQCLFGMYRESIILVEKFNCNRLAPLRSLSYHRVIAH